MKRPSDKFLAAALWVPESTIRDFRERSNKHASRGSDDQPKVLTGLGVGNWLIIIGAVILLLVVVFGVFCLICWLIWHFVF